MLSSTVASAHVLDPKLDKDPSKLRADVAKQVTGYTLCLVKAAAKCETKGVLSSTECDLATGAVAYEASPGTETAKFQAAIAKCDDKQDLDKKGTDYVGIGCPGDCSEDPGIQQCPSLAAYESTLEVADGVKAQIGLLGVVVDAGCASAGTPDSEARIDCVADATSQLTKYASSIAKCAQTCELDAKGTKGGGATTNAGNCLFGDPEAHPTTTACEAKAALKLTAPAASLAPVLAGVVNTAIDNLFNTEDATDPDSPAGELSPCGTCGNGDREGTESCDGSDFGDCDACASDCTCTDPVCGNGILEGGEECDGTELGTCGGCTAGCDCVEDPILDGPAGSFCSTSINAATTNFQPLCVPTNGSGQHFRMEGIFLGTADNGFVYLTLGFAPGLDTVNTSPTSPTAGDGRFIFTAGKSVSCGFSWNYFRYSGLTTPNANPCAVAAIFDGYRDVTDTPAPAYPGPGTVCLDVTDDNPPRVTMWATGVNGANCKDKASLTLATAVYSKDDWASANNQPISGTTHYAKINNTTLATMTTVAVSSNTVLP